MPNNTDLTIFKRGGLAGMNFAFIGRPEFYHTAQDDVAHLDMRSLQEQGRYALSLVSDASATKTSAGNTAATRSISPRRLLR